jgi:hypothetical protein
MGAPGLAWSANLFAGTSPRTGMFDPLVYIHGEEVFLHYGGRDVVMVGDRHDALYLRTLHDTLAGAEKRIDAWLARDRRWSVFLLQRRGHHEWVPAGMASAFGPVRPAWHGTWSLEKRFVDFRPAPIDGEPVLRVRRSGGQTVAQFEAGGTAPYACELRYSGANSLAPDGASSTVLGSVTGLTDAGFPTTEAAFAPLDPRKRYRQVLVQCGEALSGWMSGVLISSLCVGLLAAIGLTLLGVKLVAANAVLAGLLLSWGGGWLLVAKLVESRVVDWIEREPNADYGDFPGPVRERIDEPGLFDGT